jgi:hypothetical protein
MSLEQENLVLGYADRVLPQLLALLAASVSGGVAISESNPAGRRS